MTVVGQPTRAPHSASVLNVIVYACIVVFIGCARSHGCISVHVNLCIGVHTVRCNCTVPSAAASSRVAVCASGGRVPRGVSLPRQRGPAAAHVEHREEHAQRPPGAAGRCCPGAVGGHDGSQSHWMARSAFRACRAQDGTTRQRRRRRRRRRRICWT